MKSQDDSHLEMCLYNHGEVGVVRLGHVFLVLAQLDGHDVAQVGAGVVPGAESKKHPEEQKSKTRKERNISGATTGVPGAGHETEDERLLRPSDLVGRPEHLLGLQHLVLDHREGCYSVKLGENAIQMQEITHKKAVFATFVRERFLLCPGCGATGVEMVWTAGWGRHGYMGQGQGVLQQYQILEVHFIPFLFR